MDKETKVNSSHELIKLRHESTKSRLDLTNQNLWLTYGCNHVDVSFKCRGGLWQGLLGLFH